MKDINDAVKMLSPQYRSKFIKLFEVSGCMDWNYDTLSAYFDQLINQVEWLNTTNKKGLKSLHVVREAVIKCHEEVAKTLK